MAKKKNADKKVDEDQKVNKEPEIKNDEKVVNQPTVEKKVDDKTIILEQFTESKELSSETVSIILNSEGQMGKDKWIIDLLEEVNNKSEVRGANVFPEKCCYGYLKNGKLMNWSDEFPILISDICIEIKDFGSGKKVFAVLYKDTWFKGGVESTYYNGTPTEVIGLEEWKIESNNTNPTFEEYITAIHDQLYDTDIEDRYFGIINNTNAVADMIELDELINDLDLDNELDK